MVSYGFQKIVEMMSFSLDFFCGAHWSENPIWCYHWDLANCFYIQVERFVFRREYCSLWASVTWNLVVLLILMRTCRIALRTSDQCWIYWSIVSQFPVGISIGKIDVLRNYRVSSARNSSGKPAFGRFAIAAGLDQFKIFHLNEKKRVSGQSEIVISWHLMCQKKCSLTCSKYIELPCMLGAVSAI